MSHCICNCGGRTATNGEPRYSIICQCCDKGECLTCYPEERQQVKDALDALHINKPEVTKGEMIAKMIANNDHLKQFLKTIDPCQRRTMYGMLKNYLDFRPKPFFLLMTK